MLTFSQISNPKVAHLTNNLSTNMRN